MREGAPAGKRSDSATAAPEPTRALSVGVTGHRLERLGDAGVEAVTAAAGQVLRAVEKAVHDHAGSDDAVRMVTAVADGTDTIFAEAALERGWLLDVVLPFSRDAYVGDFGVGPPRETYERLLAASRSLFELDVPAAADAERPHAYERAGRIVLSQTDLLIAVWDEGPVRGRGGAAQIVAEAVLEGIPVIHVNPLPGGAVELLWDGLQDHDLGQQSIETVPRGDLSALTKLVAALLDPPKAAGETAMQDWFDRGAPHPPMPGLAWPLLLALVGVQRPRLPDFRRGPPGIDAVERLCGDGLGGFEARVREGVAPLFNRADRTANHFARIFRSSYVSNFILAAVAVLLTLLGLALPYDLKAVLVVLEFMAIGTILVTTRAGRRGGWQRRWLDTRALAERLRCLVVSAQLGELGLRRFSGEGSHWVNWTVRGAARALGLPSATVDAKYLACCRAGLEALIDDQIEYLGAEARRMYRLEHRLHLLGTAFFATTAIICLSFFLLQAAPRIDARLQPAEWLDPLLLAASVASAALPAFGAAIYGIRMQGDFAGNAARSEAMRHRLAALRAVMAEDEMDFDTLRRRALRATDLLTSGLGSWLETYSARPLSLPG